MGIKLINVVITVLAGVGAAVILYWVLDKLVELLPTRLAQRIRPYIYILPAYLAVTFFLLYPSIQTIIYSFMDSTSTSFVGLQNYQDLLGSEAFRTTLTNTLLWMVIVPTLTVLIGLGIAVMADRLSPAAESFSKTIIFMPMAISMVGAATVWRFLYAYRPEGQPQIGLQNAIVTAFGHEPIAWLEQSQFRFNSFLLMVMLLWAQVGFSMVLMSSAIKGVPAETLEAAKIDGASDIKTFWFVVVPQIKGTVVTVFVTTLIGVMKIFDVVYVMTNGNYNTNVIGLEFFNQLFTNFNNGSAAAIVVLLMIATVPIMWYQIRQFKAEEAAA